MITQFARLTLTVRNALARELGSYVGLQASFGRGHFIFPRWSEHNRSNSLENVYDAYRVSAGIEWEI